MQSILGPLSLSIYLNYSGANLTKLKPFLFRSQLWLHYLTARADSDSSVTFDGLQLSKKSVFGPILEESKGRSSCWLTKKVKVG